MWSTPLKYKLDPAEPVEPEGKCPRDQATYNHSQSRLGVKQGVMKMFPLNRTRYNTSIIILVNADS